jgi:putative tricarboxylic transport membrane protein
MIPFGWLAIKCSSQMLRVPRNILMPGILMFCIVGSFAINNTVFDMGIMLIMGIIGYFLEANGSPVAPVVLGLVLGPLVEKNFMMSVIKTDWNLAQFFTRTGSDPKRYLPFSLGEDIPAMIRNMGQPLEH